ncbi:hypothetical protein CEXT_623271 [Caerostris extrusa]|uniref:Uncharacterized protein n=1 Tax=Caerostris extrusa TaxID=172846 RepID=A0AAV4WGH7_CAEEX|nr:hypothetical protein CEXT_623271 [Caerostris extrusa]
MQMRHHTHHHQFRNIIFRGRWPSVSWGMLADFEDVPLVLVSRKLSTVMLHYVKVNDGVNVMLNHVKVNDGGQGE